MKGPRGFPGVRAAGLLSAGFLLFRKLAEAVEAPAEGAAVVIERSPVDWLLLLVGLGIFWIVLIGLFTTLVMKVKEADRVHRLRR